MPRAPLPGVQGPRFISAGSTWPRALCLCLCVAAQAPVLRVPVLCWAPLAGDPQEPWPVPIDPLPLGGAAEVVLAARPPSRCGPHGVGAGGPPRVCRVAGPWRARRTPGSEFGCPAWALGFSGGRCVLAPKFADVRFPRALHPLPVFRPPRAQGKGQRMVEGWFLFCLYICFSRNTKTRKFPASINESVVALTKPQ